MKRIRFFALLLPVLTVLTVSALADFGPKPQLVVRVENAPAEPYYLDILDEGAYTDDAANFNGLEWSYSEEEAAALDGGLLALLLENVPEGWHACTAQGSTRAPMWGDLYPESYDNGVPLHIFGYHGVPAKYRILMVTKSGQVFLSGPLERASLQCSATVDWAARTAGTPTPWLGRTLQFLSTLLPTLLLEGAVLFLFGLWRSRRNRLIFLAVNLVTQGILAALLSMTALKEGVSISYFALFFPGEIAVLLAESLFYRKTLDSPSPNRAFAYGAAANLISAAAGYFTAETVWRWVVSIS